MKLGIGTVQFGMAYGISNPHGQVGTDAATEIIATAKGAGIDLFDTAAGYGEAETALGHLLGGWPGARIVTKTRVLKNKPADAAPGVYVADGIAASLATLARPKVYGLMAHLADDLLGPDGDAVWRAMEDARSAGLVQRIGTSCYTPAEAETLLTRYPLEIIQVPFNVFDQRMLRSGVLQACRAKGVEVHVRSVFLQGLFFMNPDALPAGFGPAEAPLRAFNAVAAGAGLSPLALALGFVLDCDLVDCAIVGVTTARELDEIVAAAASASVARFDAGRLNVTEQAIITPSMWPPASADKFRFQYQSGSGA